MSSYPTIARSDGHPPADADRGLEQAEGGDVVGAERGGRAARRRAGRRGAHRRRDPRRRSGRWWSARPGPPPAGRRRCHACLAPAYRSRTWPSDRGPPMNATRVWPRSIRCSTANRPPRTSSTATEQKRSSSRARSTSTTGTPRSTTASIHGGRGVDRGEQDALHPLLHQRGEVGLLALGAVVAVADDHGHVRDLGGDLDALGDVGEERVGGVEHHVGDRPAGPHPQLAGELVAHEAELGHRPLDPLPGAGADHLGAVQHVGDGAEGDAGRGGDVLDGGDHVTHLPG